MKESICIILRHFEFEGNKAIQTKIKFDKVRKTVTVGFSIKKTENMFLRISNIFKIFRHVKAAFNSKISTAYLP